jgi:hypothetical protein
MSHVRVVAKIITDNTSHRIEIPVILIGGSGQLQPLEPLLNYFIRYSAVRSHSWMKKLCQIVGLLLDYLDAHYEKFEKPVALFETFAQRIYSGTIGADGSDQSGLYWLPRRAKAARQLLQMLSEFSDDLHVNYGSAQLNPWTVATSYEERLFWAAYVNKVERSFLGHLASGIEATEIARQARAIRLRRPPRGENADTKAFPDKNLQALIADGFINPGKASSPDILEKYDWRGICITLLMNGGGLRTCECFHIWVHDIVADPNNPDMALVRVYHPIDGVAPKDFKLPNGRHPSNRQAYLAAKHPGYIPRNLATGTYHAGWKNPKLTDENQGYMHVHWFPSEVGRYFLRAWKLYMLQRLRAKISADEHPFLFVSFRDLKRGEPYTIDAFREAHARAVRRIGLDYGRSFGTANHCHRHAYGQRAAGAKLDKKSLQAGLHHSSIESQDVYTEPSFSTVNAAMEAASSSLENGFSISIPDATELREAPSAYSSRRLKRK